MLAVLLLVVATPVPTLTLDEALAELEHASPSLEQARRRAEEAGAVARQVQAGYLPSLSAAGSFVRNSEAAVAPLGSLGAALLPPGSPRLGDLVIQPLEAFLASVTLRVPLLAPQAWADASAATSAARASRESAVAVASRPAASRATAVNVCAALVALVVDHST